MVSLRSLASATRTCFVRRSSNPVSQALSWVILAVLIAPAPALASAIKPRTATAAVFQPAPRGFEAQFTVAPPSFPAIDKQPGGFNLRWSHTLEICLGIVITALVPCFIEWQWMAARQEYLRSIVSERTRELEAEKAELLKAKAALVQLASRDSLTGVFNRAAIMDLLEQEILRANREHTSVAIVLADLDNFKRVNDSHGHLAGDAVLREFALRIQGGVRPGDYVGRYGGEELLILLRCLPDGSGGRVADLHRKVNQSPYMLDCGVLPVTSSFGAVWFTGPATTATPDSVSSLLSQADEALYRAKANGRNRVELATSPKLLGPVLIADADTHTLTA